MTPRKPPASETDLRTLVARAVADDRERLILKCDELFKRLAPPDQAHAATAELLRHLGEMNRGVRGTRRCA